VFFYTRQRTPLPSVFSLGKDKFQSTFWSSKLSQMKKFSITNFILVISLFGKAIVTLFINLYFSHKFYETTREIYKICEQC
jgi:hypothetical protein